MGATPTPVTPTPTPGGSEDCDTRSQSSTLEEKNAGFFTCSEDGSADSEVRAEQLTIDRLGGELCDSKLCISGKCDTGGCQSADPDLEGVEVGKCSLVGDSKAAEDRIVELEREAGALLDEADGLRKDLGDSPDLRDGQKKMEEKMQEALEANNKASDLKAIAKTCKESEKVFECQLSGTIQCRCDCVSAP